MKFISISSTLLGAALAWALPALPASADAAKPNIVVFLCDDLGFLDSSLYGATDVRTPNIQRFADAGLTFDRAYVASPACAPSRAAMLTGMMPARNGAEANHTYARPEIKGIPTYLRGQGYDVAAFGKVAHGADVKRWDFTYFDEKFSVANACDWLAKRDAEKPVCLFVGTHDPPVSWDKNKDYDPKQVKLPANFVDTPETREYRTDYYTEITRADTDMGQLYDYTRAHLGTNTLFLFSSDHGAQWPFGKWNLYETSVRTPLIAVWPGVIKPGTRTEGMVSWVDLLPTLVELAGGTPPPGLDGKSFAGILRGSATTQRDEIFTTHSGDGRMNVYPIRAVRTERFKYIHNLYPENKHTTFIDLAKDKDGLYYWRSWVAAAKTDPTAEAIIRHYHIRPKEELYDIVADPTEAHNLATDPEHTATLDQLRAKLDAWMTVQDDQKSLFKEPHPLSEPEFIETPEGTPNTISGRREKRKAE